MSMLYVYKALIRDTKNATLPGLGNQLRNENHGLNLRRAPESAGLEDEPDCYLFSFDEKQQDYIRERNSCLMLFGEYVEFEFLFQKQRSQAEEQNELQDEVQDEPQDELQDANIISDPTPLNDLFAVREYRKDILKYFYSKEDEKLIQLTHMLKVQQNMNDSWRMTLVDKLVKVCTLYELPNETLHLAVQSIDYVLSRNNVTSTELKLAFTAALFVALKYEGVRGQIPKLKDFVNMTRSLHEKHTRQNKRTTRQILQMEKWFLEKLDFSLAFPSALFFITEYASMMNIPVKINYMAQYLCELSMLKTVPFLQYKSSKKAAAAVALAHCICDEPIWNHQMEDTFGCGLAELREVIVRLNNMHSEAQVMKQQAIQKKFRSSAYLEVGLQRSKGTQEVLTEILAKLNATDE